ncbi:hypothetical protein D4R87_02855 [bacterium]|nr:MAG: hypothetical protein D4R87_02855 [bacterium]
MDITNINQLKNTDNFIQVDYLKGYKFLDKTGEIFNNFQNTGSKIIPGIDNLTVLNSEEWVESLKISSKSLWIHFLFSELLQTEKMIDILNKNIRKIFSVIGVKEVNRIGWRRYFIYDFKNEHQRKETVNKLVSVKNANLKELNIGFQLSDIIFDIRIVKVHRKDGIPGLLLDVDFYKEYKNLSAEKIVLELEKIKDLASGEDFLNIINSIL